MVKFLCICQSENKSEKRQTNKRKNATTTMRENVEKRCSTQRANDKFSLAFWQLVLAGFLSFFFFYFDFWLFLGLFAFCSCFDFCVSLSLRLKTKEEMLHAQAEQS